MHINRVCDWDPTLKLEIKSPCEFHSLGPVDYDTEEMCTYAEDLFYLKAATKNPNVSVIFVRAENAAEWPSSKSYVLTPQPVRSFYEFHNHLASRTDFYGERKPSQIHRRARINPTAYVAPEGVSIGEDVVVEPHATIWEGSILEPRVVIKSGARIGAEGLEYKTVEGKRIKAIHAGGVRIGENSEIGANSVIVRNVFNGHTRVGANVVIGNLVNVGHQCVVEDGAIIMPSAVLCGSSTVKVGARIGVGAIVNNRIVVGEEAVVTMGSVVIKDVPPGKRITGYFAMEHTRFLRGVHRMTSGE